MKYITTLILTIFLSSFSANIVAQTFNQYVKEGKKSFEKGAYFEAIHYLKKASKFGKNNSEVYYFIGQSYLELKDYNKSLKAFSKVKEKSAYPLLMNKMANSFMLTGDYNQAIKYFDSFKKTYKESNQILEIAKQRQASCYWALDHSKLNETVNITALDKTINSQFSEFAAGYFKDSLLQLTSFHQEENDKKSRYISDIYFYKQQNEYSQPVEIAIPKNKKLQLANGFYLKEKNRFYYNQCEATNNGNKRCDIYVSEYKDGVWAEAIKLNINEKDFTSTQAFVYIDNSNKDVLLFVSDRDGGFGKNDIWIANETSLGVFENLKVLPKTINSIENEASPYFVKDSNKLYFSSQWHYGFGGYDIFEAKGKNIDYKKPKNVGLPYNSSADDLYFNINYNKEGMLSSNRTGATILRGISCCYDIFSFNKRKQLLTEIDSISVIDSLITEHTTEKDYPKKIDSAELILNKIRAMMPITVYFHNDEPNPKTSSIVTNVSYNEAYNSFKSLKNEYYKMNDFNEIDAFFYDNLDKGYIDLKAFKKLLALIVPNSKLKLEIKGYCSPLAKNDYNINLSKRRISSVENELKNNTVLNDAIRNNRLNIVELPFGEEKADKSVSDDYYNTKLSIFNPNAAKERKVSVVGILIE